MVDEVEVTPNINLKKPARGTFGWDTAYNENWDILDDHALRSSTIQYVGDIKVSLQKANHGNWFLCNGQEISRTDYPDLFNLLGTNFGVGNGTSTFNLPDYRGKFLRGLGGNSAPTMYVTQGESVPAHTHYIANGDYGGSQNVTINSGNSLTQEGGSSATQAISYRLNGTNTTPSKGKTSNASGTLYSGSHVTPINQAVNYFILAKTNFER